MFSPSSFRPNRIGVRSILGHVFHPFTGSRGGWTGYGPAHGPFLFAADDMLAFKND
jgi:hypothetical protein